MSHAARASRRGPGGSLISTRLNASLIRLSRTARSDAWPDQLRVHRDNHHRVLRNENVALGYHVCSTDEGASIVNPGETIECST